MYGFIKELEKYCDKQRVYIQIDERKDGTIEIAIDNFSDFEKGHISDYLRNNSKILDSEYLAGNGWWWLIEPRIKESKKSATKLIKESNIEHEFKIETLEYYLEQMSYNKRLKPIISMNDAPSIYLDKYAIETLIEFYKNY